MKDGFIWCPHCGKPHKLGDQVCPSTGLSLNQRIHRTLPAPRKPPVPRGNDHPLIGTLVDGKFEILARIGTGGMGEVFEARNRVLNRNVAMKVVSRASPKAAARFRREAGVIASIQHPNICDIYDIGTMPDGSPYLVLEILRGETLGALLGRKKRLPPFEAVGLFVQILSGLHLAHESGIVHRDLKPANVFLVARVGLPPLVKLLDFGLAKELSSRGGESRKPRETLTLPGETCGTREYMSPEQLFAKPIDARSDLFSVAIMLFEAIGGRHPFEGRTTAETALKIAHEPPLDLARIRPNVPRELALIVARALSKRAEDRPVNARVMQTELAAMIAPTDEPGADSETIPQMTLPQIDSRSSTTTALPLVTVARRSTHPRSSHPRSSHPRSKR